MRRDGTWKEYPDIDLPKPVLADLKKPWDSIRFKKDYQPPLFHHRSRGFPPNPDTNPNLNPDVTREPEPRQGARYRFLCFIHSHVLSLRPGSRRGIYTISIWDREWEELTWHDTYAQGRGARRADARLFWRGAASSLGFPFLHLHLHTRSSGSRMRMRNIEEDNPREAFEHRIRFRTVYHAASRLGDALREHPNPRHTLWAVMGVAMHHMNRGGEDPHVGVVPDRLEYFAAFERDLLPRLWAHLFLLCFGVKRGRGGGGGGGGNEDEDEDEDDEEEGEGQGEGLEQQNRRREELVSFVKQFWILERLEWMRAKTRKHLQGRLSREDVGWVFEALRIGSPDLVPDGILPKVAAITVVEYLDS